MIEEVTNELEAIDTRNGSGAMELRKLLDKPRNDPTEFYLDPLLFAQSQRVAAVFANSELAPKHLRGKHADCVILVQLAFRLKVDPFALMQTCYVVHGKPGFEAKFAIAMINQSGLFEDPLEYEFVGDHGDEDWAVIVRANRAGTGKVCETTFRWETAVKEGWVKKEGSKWRTMPHQMMMYRGATFFSRVFCPEVLLGIQTTDELEDIGEADAERLATLAPGYYRPKFDPDASKGADPVEDEGDPEPEPEPSDEAQAETEEHEDSADKEPEAEAEQEEESAEPETVYHMIKALALKRLKEKVPDLLAEDTTILFVVVDKWLGIIGHTVKSLNVPYEEEQHKALIIRAKRARFELQVPNTQ